MRNQSLTAAFLLLAVISLTVFFGEKSQAGEKGHPQKATVHPDGSVEIKPSEVGIFPSTAAFRMMPNGELETRCVGSAAELSHFASGKMAAKPSPGIYTDR